MAPDEDEFDDFDDGERFSDLSADETLDFEDGESDASSHSESVYVVDDEEAGRESFARGTSATLDLIAEQVAFHDDVIDADPNALDAAITEPSETPQNDVARRHLRGLVEALLFVSERPMKAADIADIARADVKEVRSILEDLSEEYRADSRGFQLDELATGWQLRTSAAYAPFVREFTQVKPVRLSRAQVETLAIIAYRQPITRPEIEDIRGVDAGAVLKLLLDRDMVRVLGKKDEPGRPLLYGTTGHFLTFFGLKSLKDLPTLREFTELTDESREVVERELGDVLPEGPREPPPNVVGDASVASAEDDPMVVPAGEPLHHHDPEMVRSAEEVAAEENPPEVDEEEEAERAEAETAAANDTDAEAEADDETETEDAPAGGAKYDPSDEELYPDDDDSDDEDDDDEDDDDEDDEEDDDE